MLNSQRQFLRRVFIRHKREAARLQTLVIDEEVRQAKPANLARWEEAIEEQAKDPASIQKLINALSEAKAELARVKFQLKRGQLASAIGAVHQEREP